MFSKFEILHIFPRCPHWEKMGFFRHNKSTKTGSPTPVFLCYGSTKTYKAGTMVYNTQPFVSPSAIRTIQPAWLHSRSTTQSGYALAPLCRNSSSPPFLNSPFKNNPVKHQQQHRLQRHEAAADCRPIALFVHNDDGLVQLPLLAQPPGYLKDLLARTYAIGRQFKDNLRQYNAAFAFTSLGCNTASAEERTSNENSRGDLHAFQNPW
ncbi:hypothetical protein BCV72DRAFT_335002 [Rhizopus microsporus var. microsporus]|uniref:Uncharacterized protein n=1 Tax=Rhizopus microsporus var. microsporus TaxID=86635 RepID=A0A1X0R6K3_RHIZD|nr:hypothetical protein BCV72DRAFT_335002 [Rhizopus microsporus var. microsporus]